MPPNFHKSVPRADFRLGEASAEFRKQWTHPGDVFVVLLLLGGDVIGRALAQLAGSGLTPIAFSFGWVAYAVTALVSAVGENKLMPLPDTPCKVINGRNGYVRDNSSWILGRVVRDYDSWMDDEVRDLIPILLTRKAGEERDAKNRKNQGSGDNLPRPLQAGLCVSFYDADPAKKGTSGQDIVYYSGFFTAIFQLGVAAIPCGIWGDWSVLLVTAAGIMLAFTTGLLRQWRKEKWACRENSNETVVLTRGNGAQHAILVRSRGTGLNLEDLSAGQTNVNVSASLRTRIFLLFLALLWTLLLISASGIEKDTWFLLAVGGAGILQNIFVAGWPRTPAAFGMPLTYRRVIGETKVMKTLYKVHEDEYVRDICPGLRKAMLGIFFPGDLSEEEEMAWASLAGDRKYVYQVATYMNNGQLDEAERQERRLMEVLQNELGAGHRCIGEIRAQLEEIRRTLRFRDNADELEQ